MSRDLDQPFWNNMKPIKTKNTINKHRLTYFPPIFPHWSPMPLKRWEPFSREAKPWQTFAGNLFRYPQATSTSFITQTFVGAPMGLQWEEIGENNLGEFLFFISPFVFLGFYWVYIFPKWLIKVTRPIPILFRCVLELRKCCQNMDPQTS